MALNPAERLMSVAFPAPQAKEIARQIADAGGGAVDSVNGQTGVVVLDASDVGAVEDNADGIQLPIFSATDLVAGTPDPTANAGRIVIVSDDDTAGYALAWSNGTNWLTLPAPGANVDDGS